MDSQPSQPLPPANELSGAHALMPDDDIALGWECANPALQIERWTMETAAPAEIR